MFVKGAGQSGVQTDRVFDVCATPILNISVFVPSSVGDFENAGQIRLPCVFVAVIPSAHTLT